MFTNVLRKIFFSTKYSILKSQKVCAKCHQKVVLTYNKTRHECKYFKN